MIYKKIIIKAKDLQTRMSVEDAVWGWSHTAMMRVISPDTIEAIHAVSAQTKWLDEYLLGLRLGVMALMR